MMETNSFIGDVVLIYIMVAIILCAFVVALAVEAIYNWIKEKSFKDDMKTMYDTDEYRYLFKEKPKD